MNTPGTQLRIATNAHFEAKRQEAIATLSIYFENPVGIGEHSELLTETIKWAEILANSIDCMEALKTLTPSGSQQDQ